VIQPNSKPGLVVVSDWPFRTPLGYWLTRQTLASGACNANSDFQPTLIGGNGANVPYCALLWVSTSHFWTWLKVRPSLCRILACTRGRGRFTPGNRSDPVVSSPPYQELIVGSLVPLFCSSLSVLTDLNINKASLDTSLFPGAPSNALVHQGFRDAHKATANNILAEVRDLLNSNGATSVVVVSLANGLLGRWCSPSVLFRLGTPSGELSPSSTPSSCS